MKATRFETLPLTSIFILTLYEFSLIFLPTSSNLLCWSYFTISCEMLKSCATSTRFYKLFLVSRWPSIGLSNMFMYIVPLGCFVCSSLVKLSSVLWSCSSLKQSYYHFLLFDIPWKNFSFKAVSQLYRKLCIILSKAYLLVDWKWCPYLEWKEGFRLKWMLTFLISSSCPHFHTYFYVPLSLSWSFTGIAHQVFKGFWMIFLFYQIR